MNYLNITIADLKRPEFIESEYDHIGVWLSLMAYCATVENGGVIANCSKWGDKQWGAVGVTKSYILESSPLWTLEDEDLVVSFYPVDQEASLKSKREAGKKGGRPKKADDVKGDTYNDKNHMVSREGNHMVSSEHNVKERKGKEGNSNSKGIGKKGNEKKEEELNEKKPSRMKLVNSLDLPFDSDEFRKAWDEFKEHRNSLNGNKSFTELSAKKILNKLGKVTEMEAIELIDKSIENGWKGIFLDSLNRNSNRKNKPSINLHQAIL